MEKFYDFIDGGWYIMPLKKGIYKYIFYIFRKGIKLLWYASIILCTFFITFWIFHGCIENDTLNEMIALGAVFATFGSAAVSIFSLSCSEQINHFQNNLLILQNNLIKAGKWNRWRFLRKIEKGKQGFYEIRNPKIVFLKATKKLMIPIPTDISDFKDISAGWYYLCFLFFMHSYSKYLLLDSSSQTGTETYLIFRCLKDIYQNILYYKISSFFVWVGGGFILSSVIFSFYYSQINDLLYLRVCDFDSIIFTIVA